VSGRTGDTLRAFIENGGYEAKMMSDGHRSAVPMDQQAALEELDALESELAAVRERADEWERKARNGEVAVYYRRQRDALTEALRRAYKAVSGATHGTAEDEEILAEISQILAAVSSLDPAKGHAKDCPANAFGHLRPCSCGADPAKEEK
jgi:hypothetical protein